jgi:hypothetical protein
MKVFQIVQLHLNLIFKMQLTNFPTFMLRNLKFIKKANKNPPDWPSHELSVCLCMAWLIECTWFLIILLLKCRTSMIYASSEKVFLVHPYLCVHTAVLGCSICSHSYMYYVSPAYTKWSLELTFVICYLVIRKKNMYEVWFGQYWLFSFDRVWINVFWKT